MRIRERIIRFGEEVPMVGVVSEPPERRPDAPAVIVLNAGFVHRVGPFRMNVAIARALAEAGYPAVRIDLTGLGDSPARSGSGELETRVRIDIDEAIKATLQATSTNEVVLYGMCSGAMNAHFAGIDDDRVSGLVLIDPYSWPTRKFRLIRYFAALREPHRVGGFATRSLGRFLRRSKRAFLPGSAVDETLQNAQGSVCDDPLVGTIYLAEWPAAERIAADLQRLIGRGARALMIFTGGMVEYFNYAGQLQDSLPGIRLESGVIVEHWPASDHMLTVHSDRQKLITKIVQFLPTLSREATGKRTQRSPPAERPIAGNQELS
ncbi:MAG: alpha/beta fold hydrolase [Acidobacteriota bacterium]